MPMLTMPGLAVDRMEAGENWLTERFRRSDIVGCRIDVLWSAGLND